MSQMHPPAQRRTRRYPWLLPVLLVLALGFFVAFLTRDVGGAGSWVGVASGLAAIGTYRATRNS